MTFGTIFAIGEGIVLLVAIAVVWYLVRLAKASRPQRVEPDELGDRDSGPGAAPSDADNPE